MEQEINLDEITDMNLLQNLLDQTEDIDDRKAIRGRIQELRAIERAKRDEKLARLTDTRQEMLMERQRRAYEQKQRTLAMYDQMARSAPAGGKKKMDISIYTTGQLSPPTSPNSSDKDLVEDVLQQCKRAAEERKKKILAAYEAASRSGPAGVVKGVDFEQFINADVSDYQPTKPECTSTFSMMDGVPKVPRSVPGTPLSPGFPGGMVFPKQVKVVDPAQEIIKQRQKEAEEEKQRLLKAYAYVSKQGAGPKQVVLEELKRFDVEPDELDVDPRLKKVVGTAGGLVK